MFPYSVLMFVISGIFAVVSYYIYKGNTNLIHSYHRTKVKDKAAYGRAFGKALSVFAIVPFASGVVGLLGEERVIALITVLILVVGIIVGTVCIVAVQKKYNNGVF